MAVIVSAVIVLALIVLAMALFRLVRAVWRLAAGPSRSPGSSRYDERREDVSSFGRLHTPADPVGPIGSLSPEADLSSSAGSADDLYGD